LDRPTGIEVFSRFKRLFSVFARSQACVTTDYQSWLAK
jgi:hypothetical protein